MGGADGGVARCLRAQPLFSVLHAIHAGGVGVTAQFVAVSGAVDHQHAIARAASIALHQKHDEAEKNQCGAGAWFDQAAIAVAVFQILQPAAGG